MPLFIALGATLFFVVLLMGLISQHRRLNRFESQWRRQYELLREVDRWSQALIRARDRAKADQKPEIAKAMDAKIAATALALISTKDVGALVADLEAFGREHGFSIDESEDHFVK